MFASIEFVPNPRPAIKGNSPVPLPSELEVSDRFLSCYHLNAKGEKVGFGVVDTESEKDGTVSVWYALEHAVHARDEFGTPDRRERVSVDSLLFDDEEEEQRQAA